MTPSQFFASLSETEQTEVLDAAMLSLTDEHGKEFLDLSDEYAAGLVRKLRGFLNRQSDGDDLCDKCMRSGVQASRTDEAGNTICAECDVCEDCNGSGWLLFKDEEIQRCDQCQKFTGDLQAAIAYFASGKSALVLDRITLRRPPGANSEPLYGNIIAEHHVDDVVMSIQSESTGVLVRMLELKSREEITSVLVESFERRKQVHLFRGDLDEVVESIELPVAPEKPTPNLTVHCRTCGKETPGVAVSPARIECFECGTAI